MEAAGPPSLRFETATPATAPVLAALHTAVALDLTARFGPGGWSRKTSEKGAHLALRTSLVRVAWGSEGLSASFALTAKKPWAIDTAYFSACVKSLYLVNMAVDPRQQRQGLGRACIEDAKKMALAWPADAIRLDAYDAAAGAAKFYAKAGLREVARVSYRTTPLVYFELLLAPQPCPKEPHFGRP
jgi:GNAT superfamily N-acetyltransferase